MNLVIDEQFWVDLYERLDNCHKQVHLQFMTFEGDKTGLELSDKLIELAQKGIEIEILIDCYTDYYVSDTFYKNHKVAKEVADTKQMIIDMRQAGILIKRTRPYGLFGKNFLSRNHKKIVIIDDYAYLGGINISDHNRDWFDFMVGISDINIVSTIKNDFKATFNGSETNMVENNVYTTRKLEELYLRLVAEAREEIIVSSPYILDVPLLELFKSKKEIKKKILTIRDNNIWIINRIAPYLLYDIQKTNTEIFFYTKFSHAKFLLIDRKYLLIGSSNFCKDSFLNKQEIGLLIEDKSFVRDFYQRVIMGTDMQKCEKVPNRFISYYMAHFLYFVVLYYAKFIARNIPTLKKEKFT